LTTCCHVEVCVHTTITLLQLEAGLCHIVEYNLYAAVAGVLWHTYSDMADLADLTAVVNRAEIINHCQGHCIAACPLCSQTDRCMDSKKVEGRRDRPAGQAGRHTSRQAYRHTDRQGCRQKDRQACGQTDRQACRQTDRQPFDQYNSCFAYASGAASAHLAMGISQLLMQRPIAVLQLLHLPLQRLPCTLYCRQVCYAIGTSLTLLLPAYPEASTHAQCWLVLLLPADICYTLCLPTSC